MLLRFSVENFLSINERQELSLAASVLKDREEGLIACPQAPHGKALPAVVVYGANASGKSNLIKAFAWMTMAINRSHNRFDPGGGVPRKVFALDPSSDERPSAFSMDFVLDGVRYHYGFEATDKAFTSEWLYAFPKSRPQTLFERENERKITFGRELKGRKEGIAELMRPNSLFLSTANQVGHAELSKISLFFQSIEIENNFGAEKALLSRLFSDGDIDNRVIEFMTLLNTGIIDYRVEYEQESPDRAELRRNINKAIIQNFGEAPANFVEFKGADTANSIELAHRRAAGEPVYFDLNQESEGTRRLLVLLHAVYRALDRGTAVIIDEINASLHPQACEALMSLFLTRATNPRGAQLVATTHDTNLMRSKLLRRDQIVFTEKDETGATHLFPLSDIRARQSDNIEKGYLEGRYGAIPFAGSVEDLLAKS